MRSGRNNVMAGTMVLLSIIAALVVVILLAGGLEQFGKRTYTVHFSLSEGIAGLEPGSRVFVGGQEVGVVAEQEFVHRGAGIDGVRVSIRVDTDVTLRQGAVAQLISPLLGGSATINFPHIGDGAELGPDDPIDGQIAPPGLLAQAGYGPEQAAQLQRIMARADAITEQFQTLSNDAQAILADLRGRTGPWFDRVESITKNVDEAATRGPAITESLEARLAQLRDLIAENREDIRTAIANGREITAKANTFMDRLNGEMSDLAVGLLEDARASVDSGKSALDDARGLLGEQTPNLRRSIANFRLASEELTSMMNEVRRSPWRLLYRPDKREMDFELLYDSARAYAGAVGDLRIATEAMQSIANSADPTARAKLPELVEEVEASFDRYRDAEAAFLREIAARTSQQK